jgi:hypothetical protein
MKSLSKADFVPVRNRDALFRKNPDGTLAILRLDNDEYYYTINGLAAEVWLMIDGKSSVEAISKKIVAKHSVPLARFQNDVHKLLQSLVKERLIEKADGRRSGSS